MDHPQFHATGYYEDASVLSVGYSHGDGPERVQFAFGVDPALHDDVRSFFARHEAYAEYPEENASHAGIRVHEVYARRLVDDADPDARLQERLAATGTPEETGNRAFDCGRMVVDVWPGPERVRFGCRETTDAGWDEVWAVMQELDAWARQAPAAERVRPAWNDTDAEVWFTQTSGCSMCGFFGGTTAKASTLAVFRDGSLLWYSFALGPENITFSPGLEPWRDEVLAVHGQQHHGWSEHLSHVADVHAIHTGDWAATTGRLSTLHDELRDPGPADRSNCADCGGPWVEVFDPHLHASLFRNYEEGDPWDRLLDELRAMAAELDSSRSSPP